MKFCFPGGARGKKSTCYSRDVGSIPEMGGSPREGNATHSSILACKIPQTEVPGGLQSMGLQSWALLSDWALKSFKIRKS